MRCFNKSDERRSFAQRQNAHRLSSKSMKKPWQRLFYKPKFERLEDRTQPAALSPFAFTSLGTFNPATPGTYTVDESGPNPVIRDPGNSVIFTGVFFNTGSNTDAVFDFSSFSLMNGITLTYTTQQPDPVVLLSRTTMTIAGTIDFSGQSTFDFRALSLQANDTTLGGPGGNGGGIGNIQPFNVGADFLAMIR